MCHNDIMLRSFMSLRPAIGRTLPSCVLKQVIQLLHTVVRGNGIFLGAEYWLISPLRYVKMAAVSDSNRDTLAENGVIPLLVEALQHLTEEERTGIAQCGIKLKLSPEQLQEGLSSVCSALLTFSYSSKCVVRD